jgi:LmbE family N-acetylglucosaminyl deacetylase
MGLLRAGAPRLGLGDGPLATTVQQLGAWRYGRPQLGLPPGPVLVLTAHPDDEVLAFGGTLARLAAAEVDVQVVCATAGEATFAGGVHPRHLAARRRDELRTACAWLGVEHVECLDLPDGRLRTVVDDLVAAVSQRIAAMQPAAVLLPWWRDAHSDHQTLSVALLRAAVGPRLQVWAGEIWTPLPATHVVDISGVALARKRTALSAYDTAGRTLQLDAVLGLNRYRAFAATATCEAAEGFVVASLSGYAQLVAGGGAVSPRARRHRSRAAPRPDETSTYSAP